MIFRACGMRGPKWMHLMGAISYLCLIPLLFHQDDHQDKNDSPFLHVIQSNTFENHVYVSLALAFPSVLDVMADVVEKGSIRLFDDAQFCRIVLALSLLTQPLLLLYFALCRQGVVSSYAVLNIRGIACATVTMEQLHIRCDREFTFRISIFMLVLWNFGSIIGSYSIRHDPFTSSMNCVSVLAKGVAGIVLLVCLLRHYISTTKDILNHSEHKYQRWHTIALEMLIVATLSTYAVLATLFAEDYVFDYGEEYILGTSYTATLFQYLYSNILTQEVRFDLVVAKEKLSVKRQFVRYVSHEVRTPLNSCALGLSYLRNMCTDLAAADASPLPPQSPPRQGDSDSQVAERRPAADSSALMLTVIDEIADCCDTAVDFMNNLLFYEKIDSLDLALYFKVENLRDICLKSFNAFLLSSRHLNIQFTLEVHESIDENSGQVPKIRADYAKLNVVFRNIISNAMKFTSPGSAVKFRLVPIAMSPEKKASGVVALHQLDATPALTEAATTHYRVIVEDQGIGMSAQEQKDLFGREIQFNPNESQSGGGSGIGLYLSQKIVRDHGTCIQVHSEGVRGRGTKFFIDFAKYHSDSLALKLDSLENSALESSVYSGGEVPSGIHSILPRHILTKPMSDLSIMIVDDSLISRKMFRRTLEQHHVGSSYDQAGDGVELLSILCCPAESEGEAEGDEENPQGRIECISALAGPPRPLPASSSKKYQVHPASSVPQRTLRKSYDIIVIDKSMPLMNGDVATAKLREWGYQGIIFGLTGNALAEDLQSFCDMGANHTFSKPLNLEEFVRVLREFYL